MDSGECQDRNSSSRIFPNKKLSCRNLDDNSRKYTKASTAIQNNKKSIRKKSSSRFPAIVSSELFRENTSSEYSAAITVSSYSSKVLTHRNFGKSTSVFKNTLVCLLFLLVSIVSPTLGQNSEMDCDISEFACDDGGCVSLSHFCDGVAQCRDYSDEPPGCTVCNRTYRGYVDRTYKMIIPSTPARRSLSRSAMFMSNMDDGRKISPDWDGNPENSDFICILTFVAKGKRHGDIIQINFDEFHVGHFNSTGAIGGGSDGCSGDHVTIEEPKSVYWGGRWCGKGLGLNVYYSETDVLIVTLKASTATFGEYFDDPLRFTLKYRFLRKDQALVRYGHFRNIKYRGELVRNTACSRVFTGCRARTCKIQSPNFPGLYPRNVTCYYLIKALKPPSADLIPVIILSQANDRLMQIGQREHASRVSPESKLKQNQECINPEDYVLVYDGGAMRFPLLSKFCGTASLDNITSSGPEMLVVFKTSASGQMNHLANLATGFELNINVMFMKKNPNLVPSEDCEENIKSFGATSGIIYHPVYAMPSNSSCKYNFIGRRNEIIWFYFTKYHREENEDRRMPFDEVLCRNKVSIYDGSFSNGTFKKDDQLPPLMGEYCDEEIPPLCVRSREKGFAAKPCSFSESFLSKSSNVVIIQEFTHSTSLQPVEYVIHYEFVSIQPEIGGASSVLNSSCDMDFDSSELKRGHITAPKSVFYYGRGGRTNLFCKYKFTLRDDEAIKLKIVNINFPDRLCKTIENLETNVYDCIARITGSAILEAYETYWNNTKLILGCICDNRLQKINIISYANLFQLDFIIRDMNWSQDYNDFSFEVEFEYISIDNCTEKKEFNGTNGVITLSKSLEGSTCSQVPWKIRAKNTRHIYMNIPGYHGTSKLCKNKNRIVIYDTETGRPIKAICPSIDDRESIDVFSSGWSSHLEWPRSDPVNIVFKYLPQDQEGLYYIKWLEVTREPRASALESSPGSSSSKSSSNIGGWLEKQQLRPSSCGTECPEIAACISKKLWCDGTPHCPSGADEDRSTCLYASIPWMYVVLITVSLVGLIFGIIVVFVVVKVFQKGKIKRKKKKEAQRLMTQEILLPMTYHHKDNIDNLENYYLRGGI